MRLALSLITTLAMLLSASSAFAYGMTLQLAPTSPDPASEVSVGDTFAYEVYLDATTNGDNDGVGDPTWSRITFFSVSISYDSTVMGYNPFASESEDYYPLYAPAVVGVKAEPSSPATYLVPDRNPPTDWKAVGGGNTPGGLGGQINVDFIVNTGAQGISVATATNEYMATVAFNATYAGAGQIIFGFDGGGNVFSINGNGTAIDLPSYTGSEVLNVAIASGGTILVPEPGLAVMALGALATLGMLRRGQR